MQNDATDSHESKVLKGRERRKLSKGGNGADNAEEWPIVIGCCKKRVHSAQSHLVVVRWKTENANQSESANLPPASGVASQRYARSARSIRRRYGIKRRKIQETERKKEDHEECSRVYEPGEKTVRLVRVRPNMTGMNRGALEFKSGNECGARLSWPFPLGPGA